VGADSEEETGILKRKMQLVSCQAHTTSPLNLLTATLQYTHTETRPQLQLQLRHGYWTSLDSEVGTLPSWLSFFQFHGSSTVISAQRWVELPGAAWSQLSLNSEIGRQYFGTFFLLAGTYRSGMYSFSSS
jgi:hypothetical protein